MKGDQAKKIIDQAIEQLAEALANGKSETLTAYLAAMGRFRAYSLGNVLLILAQRPQASRIAGYRTWRTLGRHVKKGEKGILIVAPIVTHKARVDANARGPPENDLAQDEEDDRDESWIRFKPVHVFDVLQTDGKPLPEFARVGGNPSGHTEKLKAFITSHGITLEYSNSEIWSIVVDRS